MLLRLSFHGPGLRGLQHTATVIDSFVPPDRTNALSFVIKDDYRGHMLLGELFL